VVRTPMRAILLCVFSGHWWVAGDLLAVRLSCAWCCEQNSVCCLVAETCSAPFVIISTPAPREDSIPLLPCMS
jgi:hypothetical protein